MIPTMILVGLGLGLIPRQWEHRVGATVGLSALMALAWGILVAAPVTGALLALVNIAVGIPLGLGVQWLGYAVRRRPPHAQRERGR